MASIVFDVSEFRTWYPEFSSITVYPDAVLESNFSIAECYLENQTNSFWSEHCLKQGLYLLTAHIAKTGNLIASGQKAVLVASTGVAPVTVSLTPPPVGNSYNWWLQTTSYGAAYVALAQRMFGCGGYVGGWPERSGARKIYGVF